MDISTASLDLASRDYQAAAGTHRGLEGTPAALKPAGLPDRELLQRIAWEIGERRTGDSFVPPNNHVGLGMVHPSQGFAHWRLLHDWVEQNRQARGHDWDGCR